MRFGCVFRMPLSRLFFGCVFRMLVADINAGCLFRTCLFRTCVASVFVLDACSCGLFRTCVSDVCFGRVFRTCVSDVCFRRAVRWSNSKGSMPTCSPQLFCNNFRVRTHMVISLLFLFVLRGAPSMPCCTGGRQTRNQLLRTASLASLLSAGAVLWPKENNQ